MGEKHNFVAPQTDHMLLGPRPNFKPDFNYICFVDIQQTNKQTDKQRSNK